LNYTVRRRQSVLRPASRRCYTNAPSADLLTGLKGRRDLVRSAGRLGRGRGDANRHSGAEPGHTLWVSHDDVRFRSAADHPIQEPYSSDRRRTSRMSAWGYQRTSARSTETSAFPSGTDNISQAGHVGFVPWQHRHKETAVSVLFVAVPGFARNAMPGGIFW
jgi:hypothetical protein